LSCSSYSASFEANLQPEPEAQASVEKRPETVKITFFEVFKIFSFFMGFFI